MSKVGLLLAGGGARGIVECGYIKALKDLGIKYHSVHSSSVGTLTAMLLYPEDVDGIEKLWLEVKNKDVYTKPVFKQFLGDKPYLWDSSPLKKLIHKQVWSHAYTRLDLEWHINATDLTNYDSFSREARELCKEDLIKVITASASPPIFFPPVEYNGLKLCDSGVVNNYGISQAVKHGCDTLILMLPSRTQAQKINNMADMIVATIGASTSTYLDREIEDLQEINKYRTPPIKLITICPDVDFSFGFLDFDMKGVDRRQLIDYGYNLAQKVLVKELS